MLTLFPEELNHKHKHSTTISSIHHKNVFNQLKFKSLNRFKSKTNNFNTSSCFPNSITNIETPTNDTHRSFHNETLSNGTNILFINDALTNRYGASLCFNVGTAEDPIVDEDNNIIRQTCNDESDNGNG